MFYSIQPEVKEKIFNYLGLTFMNVTGFISVQYKDCSHDVSIYMRANNLVFLPFLSFNYPFKFRESAFANLDITLYNGIEHLSLNIGDTDLFTGKKLVIKRQLGLVYNKSLLKNELLHYLTNQPTYLENIDCYQYCNFYSEPIRVPDRTWLMVRIKKNDNHDYQGLYREYLYDYYFSKPKCFLCHDTDYSFPLEYNEYLKFFDRQGYVKDIEVYKKILIITKNRGLVCYKGWRAKTKKSRGSLSRFRAWLKCVTGANPKYVKPAIKKYDLSLPENIFKLNADRQRAVKAANKPTKSNRILMETKVESEFTTISNEDLRKEVYNEFISDSEIFEDYEFWQQYKNVVDFTFKSDMIQKVTVKKIISKGNLDDNDLFELYRYYCAKRRTKFKRNTVEKNIFLKFLYSKTDVPKRLLNIINFLRHVRNFINFGEMDAYIGCGRFNKLANFFHMSPIHKNSKRVFDSYLEAFSTSTKFNPDVNLKKTIQTNANIFLNYINKKLGTNTKLKDLKLKEKTYIKKEKEIRDSVRLISVSLSASQFYYQALYHKPDDLNAYFLGFKKRRCNRVLLEIEEAYKKMDNIQDLLDYLTSIGQ